MRHCCAICGAPMRSIRPCGRRLGMRMRGRTSASRGATERRSPTAYPRGRPVSCTHCAGSGNRSVARCPRAAAAGGSAPAVRGRLADQAFTAWHDAHDSEALRRCRAADRISRARRSPEPQLRTLTSTPRLSTGRTARAGAMRSTCSTGAPIPSPWTVRSRRRSRPAAGTSVQHPPRLRDAHEPPRIRKLKRRTGPARAGIDERRMIPLPC